MILKIVPEQVFHPRNGKTQQEYAISWKSGLNGSNSNEK